MLDFISDLTFSDNAFTRFIGHTLMILAIIVPPLILALAMNKFLHVFGFL